MANKKITIETHVKVIGEGIEKLQKEIQSINDPKNTKRSSPAVQNVLGDLREALKQLQEMKTKYDKLIDDINKNKIDTRQFTTFVSDSQDMFNAIEQRVTDLEKATSRIGSSIRGLSLDKLNEKFSNIERTVNMFKETVGSALEALSTFHNMVEASSKPAEVKVKLDKSGLKKDIEEATTEVTQFTFKNGGIRVPVTIDAKSKTALETKYNTIVRALQDYADVHPVNVTMRLFPLNANRTDAAEITNELKRIQTDIGNVEDETLKARLNALYDDLEAQFKKSLNLKVKVDLGDTEASLRQRIKELNNAIKEEGFVVYPKFEISDEEADKISNKLKDLQKDFTFDVTSQITKMSDSLNKLLSVENVESWKKTFLQSLDEIQVKITSFQNLIEPLLQVVNVKVGTKKSNIPTSDDVNILVEFTNAMSALQKTLQQQQDLKLDIDISPIEQKLDNIMATIQMLSGKLSLLATIWNELKSFKNIDISDFMTNIQSGVNGNTPIMIPISPDLSKINDFVDQIRSIVEGLNLGVRINTLGFNETERKTFGETLQDPKYANALYKQIDSGLQQVFQNVPDTLRKKIAEALVSGLRNGISSVPEMISVGLQGTEFESFVDKIIGNEDGINKIRKIANDITVAFRDSLKNDHFDVDSFISNIESFIQSSGKSVHVPISVLESSIDGFIQQAQVYIDTLNSLSSASQVDPQNAELGGKQITSLNLRIGNLQKKIEATWEYWHNFGVYAEIGTNSASNGIINVINKLQELYLRLGTIAEEFEKLQNVSNINTTGNVNNSTSESARLTAKEAKAMADLYDKAIKAAEAKNLFADANGEVLKSIISSLSALNSEGDGFKNLNAFIKNLANNSDDRITDMVANLELLRDALSDPINDNSFIKAIQDIANQQDGLKNLAIALSSSAKQITNVNNTINQPSKDDERNQKIQEYINLLNKQYELQREIVNFKSKDANDGRIKQRESELAILKSELESYQAITFTEEEHKKIIEQTAVQSKKYNDAVEQSKVKQLRDNETLIRQATELARKMAQWINANPKGEKQFGDVFRRYITDLQDVGKVTPELLDQANKVYKQADLQLTQTGEKGKSIFQMLGQRWKSLVAYLGSFASFYRMIGYIRSAINTIKDLDTQLVDLRKTTTMNSSELEEFYKNSSNVAKQLGVTTSEIISQASAWSRLGYSTKEAATQMAELSSKFTSISPGMTTDNATDYLVSTMQAYGIKVDEVERKIMDNVNRIGNTFATTNAEIGEMLTRSSAAMKAANNSLEETIALESAAVQITRNAETTGTAFRTVSMRVRGLDEETEDALENYEELKGKIADLTKTASTPGGVSLFTDASKTEYKSTYQFLKDISEIWDEINDKQQAELLEAIAGKRGAQALSGLLADFSEVERAMDEMENAAGSADAEMEIIRDSIEFKINELKQTWVQVLQDTVDRDDLKGIVDFLTTVSEGLGSIVSNLGLVKTALIAIGTVVGSQKLGYWEMKSRLRHRPVPWLKAMGKTQRPPKGVGYASKIKRELYWSNTLHSRTTDMAAVGSVA